MRNHLSAADNHSIQMSTERWRLSINDRPTAEASSLGLRYGGKFARTRRLPPTGLLDQTQIQQVVLGWQQSDEAWHLGVVVGHDLAQERGSRWVELAYWPDPEQYVFEEAATEAAQALADILGVDYQFILPRALEQAEPEPPLPEPPFTFGMWRMVRAEQGKSGYVFERLPRWRRAKYGRILWYGFWAVVYFALSLATLTSDIALPNAGTLLPNPQWLPYMGLAIAWLLITLIFWQLLVVASRPNRFVVDPAAGSITAWANRRQRWSVAIADVQSVYISEVVKRRERGPATEYGELNLHLGGGKFRFVLKQDETQSESSVPQPEELPRRATDEVVQLKRTNAFTDLQVAGLTLAEALGDLPTWYDLRVK